MNHSNIPNLYAFHTRRSPTIHLAWVDSSTSVCSLAFMQARAHRANLPADCVTCGHCSRILEYTAGYVEPDPDGDAVPTYYVPARRSLTTTHYAIDLTYDVSTTPPTFLHGKTLCGALVPRGMLLTIAVPEHKASCGRCLGSPRTPYDLTDDRHRERMRGWRSYPRDYAGTDDRIIE